MDAPRWIVVGPDTLTPLQQRAAVFATFDVEPAEEDIEFVGFSNLTPFDPGKVFVLDRQAALSVGEDL